VKTLIKFFRSIFEMERLIYWMRRAGCRGTISRGYRVGHHSSIKVESVPAGLLELWKTLMFWQRGWIDMIGEVGSVRPDWHVWSDT
jgi:hypothetical protein